jgi:hypothetical protein
MRGERLADFVSKTPRVGEPVKRQIGRDGGWRLVGRDDGAGRAGASVPPWQAFDPRLPPRRPGQAAAPQLGAHLAGVMLCVPQQVERAIEVAHSLGTENGIG